MILDCSTAYFLAERHSRTTPERLYINPEEDEVILSGWAAHFRQHYCADAVLPAMVAGTGKSREALAAVVGVLVEVPVMLSVVRIVNKPKNWCERKAAS